MCAEDASAFLEKLDAKVGAPFCSHRGLFVFPAMAISLQAAALSGRTHQSRADAWVAREVNELGPHVCTMHQTASPSQAKCLILLAPLPCHAAPQNQERARRGEPPSRPLVLTSKSRAGALQTEGVHTAGAMLLAAVVVRGVGGACRIRGMRSKGCAPGALVPCICCLPSQLLLSGTN